MKPFSRTRAAGMIAAGALATAAILAPASAAASAPQHHHGGGGDSSCTSSSFKWDVKTGRNDWAMITVHVQAKSTLSKNCTFSFSLNSYTAQGPTWPTSGTQALLDHQSITLSKAHPSGTLTVAKPDCYGQTDFYTGTKKFDGIDGALPKYPNVVTPTGLISYSNGGQACQQPSESPSQPVESEQPSSSPSEQPSESPSEQPSESPSEQPSEQPSEDPSQPVESEQPSEQPSESPSDVPSESPSDVPSEQPSTSPSDQPSSQPSGSVEGETGVPQITPPPTDTTTGSNGTSGAGWQLTLLAVSGIILSIVALTPAAARKRR
ncbi:MAG: hypothetical protein U0838_15535 [Chloroflexota bacterium]